MGKRLLTVVLGKPEYLELVRLAKDEERTVPQQATYLLRHLMLSRITARGEIAAREEPRDSA